MYTKYELGNRIRHNNYRNGTIVTIVPLSAYFDNLDEVMQVDASACMLISEYEKQSKYRSLADNMRACATIIESPNVCDKKCTSCALSYSGECIKDVLESVIDAIYPWGDTMTDTSIYTHYDGSVWIEATRGRYLIRIPLDEVNQFTNDILMKAAEARREL